MLLATGRTVAFVRVAAGFLRNLKFSIMHKNIQLKQPRIGHVPKVVLPELLAGPQSALAPDVITDVTFAQEQSYWTSHCIGDGV